VLSETGEGSHFTVAAGIDWAVAHGADVINMSLTGPSGSVTLLDAVRNASRAGVVLVAASGNYNSSVGYPAAYDDVIAVGSNDAAGNRSWFSNYGPELDLLAPGELIPTTACDCAEWNGGYVLVNGTSFSAPHVAGVAALVISTGVESPAEIRERLLTTAVDAGAPGFDNETGWGILDAAGTVAPLAPAIDADGDGVRMSLDNCPSDANGDQDNSDVLPFDNGPGVTSPDWTVPWSDASGDACDADDDNDGLPDASELSASACPPFDLSTTSHPSPQQGDVTNDDDGDGMPAPATGSDAGDNGPSWDTDNDGVLDGYECARGTNPRDRASKPPALPDDNADDDGDGLLNGWERRGWGTSISAVDSDGDGIGDCVEAADVDGNGQMNSTGDLVAYANAMFKSAGRTQDYDLDHNGLVNSTGDFLLIAHRAFSMAPCL
jgi:hypothetical protein